jgi:hypothetical protein
VSAMPAFAAKRSSLFHAVIQGIWLFKHYALQSKIIGGKVVITSSCAGLYPMVALQSVVFEEPNPLYDRVEVHIQGFEIQGQWQPILSKFIQRGLLVGREEARSFRRECRHC